MESLQLGAISLSPDILAKAHVGLWAFELDNGQPPRMYVDDIMLKLLGLDQQISPEETYHAWYDNIDPRAYSIVTDAVEKMASGQHAEVQYPWHNPDGRTMTVRCGGVRNPSYTKGIRIEGTHQDVSEMLHFQEGSVQKAKNYETVLCSVFPVIFHINLETGKAELVQGDKDAEKFVHVFNSSTTEEMFTNFYRMYVDKVVLKDDRQRVKSIMNPENFYRVMEKSNSISVNFRLRRNFEAPLYTEMRIFKASEKNGKITDAFLTFRMTDEEIRSALSLTQQIQNQIMNEMLHNEGVFLIDCANDVRKTIHNHAFSAPEFTDEEKYSTSFFRYANQYVVSADREKMRKFANPQYLLDCLKNDREVVVEFRDTKAVTPRFYQMRLARFSDHEVLQSFVEKGKETVERLLFSKMEGNYFAMYGIDLDSGQMMILKDSFLNLMGKEGDVVNYSTAIRQFASLMTPDVEKFFCNLSDISFIKNRLGKEDKISYTYQSNYSTITRWVEVTLFVLSRLADGSPSLCALTFNFLDEEASKSQDMQAKLQEDMHMIGGLASGYLTLYYVCIDDRTFKIYDLDAKKFPETAKIVSKGSDPFKMLAKFGMSEMVHPDDRHLFANIGPDDFRRKLAHSKRFSIRYRRLSDKGYVWNEMDVLKYEEVNESPNAIIIGFADRNEEIEQQLYQQKQLEETLALAQSANKAKTIFLNNMSHDIRTPMNAIIGYTSLANTHIDNKEQVLEYLDKISTSSAHLLSLINDVLDMSRIESGKMHLEEKEEDLKEIILSLKDIANANIQNRRQTLRIDITKVRDTHVVCDRLRMNQILLNVLSNAIKYTPEGGNIWISVSEKATRSNGYAEFEFRIKDDGIGMNRDFLKKVFDPFTRASSSTASGIQGTGLGMAITKSIVDMMGGKIKVTSKPAAGSEVIISLDFKVCINGVCGIATPQESENKSFDLNGTKILLVEDNELNREIATEILKEFGCIVQTADDGDTAVEMMKKASPTDFDVILMDVLMPRMNGYEATRRIRSISAYTAHIPILALTANAFEEDRRAAIAAGMNEHIAKPIDIRQLKTTLAKFIK